MLLQLLSLDKTELTQVQLFMVMTSRLEKTSPLLRSL